MTKKNRQLMAQEDYPIFDAYDSIQQHIFALAMQVGTLKLLLKRDPEAALKSLQEIEQLVQLAQLDLNMIKSLRSKSEVAPSKPQASPYSVEEA